MPDGFHGLLFEEEAVPDAVHNVQITAGDGDVDVQVLIELASIGVQGAEDADLNALLTGSPQHGPGGAAEQVVAPFPVETQQNGGGLCRQ
nr:hypothetical protein [Candidatus Erwinia dacicola]